MKPFCGELSVSSGTHRCLDEHGDFYYPNENWCVADPQSELYNILTRPVTDSWNSQSIHSTVFTFRVDSNVCSPLLDFVAKNKRPIDGLSAQDIVRDDTRDLKSQQDLFFHASRGIFI